MGKYKLPLDHTKLPWRLIREVREQYIEEQEGKCMYCGCDLKEDAPKRITDKKINWELFPKNFMKYPIHLQHNHDTGMTEGAIHAFCNAVLWQYEGR